MKKVYLPILLLLFFQFGHSQFFTDIGSNGGAGSFANATNTYGPFTTNTTVSWNRHAYIYPASLLTEIQMSPNSNIDSIFFPRVSLGGTLGMLSGTVNCKIYLKNTTATDFGAAALDWPTELATTTPIFDGDPTAIIGSTTGFKKFILTAPFIYSGDNLEILIEYTQSAAATGEVVWGYDNNTTVPDYINNSVKYISGTSGAPTNSLTSTNLRHPGIEIDYTPQSPVDAAVVAILDPSTVSCYSTSQDFSVVLRNTGNTSIAAGAAAVTLKISGANAFTSTVNNTGSIAPGNTENINFTVSLNNPGVSDDTAYVVLAGDPVTSNDTTVSQSQTAGIITTYPATEDVEGSLPVFSYASTVAIDQAWTVWTGNFGDPDLTDSLMPHGGSNFYLFDSYDFNEGTISRLYSNCLTLTHGAANTISFYMSHDNSFNTSLDSLYLTVSTDKGVTWTRIAGFARVDPTFATPGWKIETVDLSAYAGLTIQLGFEGVSHFGNIIGLDDITIVSNGVTPVTLTTFTAKRNGSVNMITWSTSQELNSFYFGVERSTDGNNFTQIGRVAAAGTSSTQRSYQFIDPKPVKGFNYYRLRIVDVDNLGKYSMVRSVRNTGLINLTVYPNPVKDKMLVDIDAEKTDKADISISDINGRKVYRSQVNLVQGINTIPVDVSHFAQGTYFMKVQLTDDSYMKKFNKE